MSDDLVWIHAHVEPMAETDDYISYTRAEWDALTDVQRGEAIDEVANNAVSNAGGYGAHVVDASEVPEEYRRA